MSNRFHNKYHKHNHHSSPNINDADSALDPIASSDSPFMGDFNLSGDLLLTAGYGVTADNIDVTDVNATNVNGLGYVMDNITASSSEIFVLSDLDIGGNSIIGLSFDKIEGVDLSTPPTLGQYLYFNGTNWVPAPLTSIIASDAEAINPAIEDKAINPKQLAGSQPSTSSLSTSFTNGVNYQNTSDRKIMVIGAFNSSNDIIVQAFIGPTSPASITAHYTYIVSDGSWDSAASCNIIVPPNWYWRIDTGGTGIQPPIRIESWEI